MTETSQPMALDPDDLNPTDTAILDHLTDVGHATAAYIADQTNYSNGNVRSRLVHLATHDHVERMGGNMWRLVDDPRDTE